MSPEKGPWLKKEKSLPSSIFKGKFVSFRGRGGEVYLSIVIDYKLI